VSFLLKWLKKLIWFGEMLVLSDADKLRTRAKRMIELANRAYCEKNYDFARLLTQLATEVLDDLKQIERAKDSNQSANSAGR
jgi:hypothetical protein